MIRRRLQLEPLEAREVPAMALPLNFTVSSGIAFGGEITVEGVYQGKPAYVSFTNGVQNPVTVLPSLSVAEIGPLGNPEGQVSDIVNVNGEITFVGFSRSESTDIHNGFGQSTTWSRASGAPTGYVVSTNPTYNSALFAGSPAGVYVGNSILGATYTEGGELKLLPNGGNKSPYAFGINESASYIVGSIDYSGAAWERNSDGSYHLLQLEGPTPGEGPLGNINGVAGNFAAGNYWDPAKYLSKNYSVSFGCGRIV